MAVAIGVWALSFVLSFSNGITYTYINNAIRDQISHLQMHHPKFPEDKNSKFYLTDDADMLAAIKEMPEVVAATSRVLTAGMVSSARTARGVLVTGVDPAGESEVTHFEQKIVEGEYFGEGRKNELLLSQRLSEKLKVKLRSRVVLTFQNLDGEITSAAFRVVGLFNSGNALRDEATVLVKKNELSAYMLPIQTSGSIVQNAHNQQFAQEIAIYLKDPKLATAVKSKLQAAYPAALTEDYWQLSPDIELYETQIKTSNSIVITIFMLALIFGIINTMLMAVLERYKELGMLMAIGLNKAKIFGMIVLETLMLGLVAAPIGLVLGFLTVYFLQDVGIDLSAFSRGLERFGIDTRIFPVLDGGLYVSIAFAVFVTTLIAAIYPARKAVKLQPVEALQKL